MSSVISKMPLEAAARFFKAVGDETRLRILALLSHGELCVCHIETALELSQPSTSRQLAVLKNAGVVASRRAGSWVYYRVAEQADAVAGHQLNVLIKGFANQATLAKDVERLLKAEGPAACR